MHKKSLQILICRKKIGASLTQPNICPPRLRTAGQPVQVITRPEARTNIIPERQESPVSQSSYRRGLSFPPKAIKTPPVSTAITPYHSSSLNPLCCDRSLSPLGLSLVKTKNIGHHLLPLIICHILTPALCPIADFFLMNYP